MEYINLENWPRRDHFQFFSGLAFPLYNVTTTLDVTRLRRYAKERGLSFYYAMIYVTLAVMNGLDDFRYKIRGEQIVKHDKLDSSFVVLDVDTHLLKIVNAPFAGTMEDFCAQCIRAVAEQSSPFPDSESEQRDDLVYFSCTPWFSFTSLTNEVEGDPDDSIPRITWGKFEEKDGKWLLPYAVQLNHRLLDGWHLGQLVNGVQAYIDQLA